MGKKSNQSQSHPENKRKEGKKKGKKEGEKERRQEGGREGVKKEKKKTYERYSTDGLKHFTYVSTPLFLVAMLVQSPRKAKEENLNYVSPAWMTEENRKAVSVNMITLGKELLWFITN